MGDEDSMMAGGTGMRTTFARMSPMMIKRSGTNPKMDKPMLTGANPETDFNRESALSKFLFPGIPAHYPLKKKILLTKNNSTIGSVWDSFQMVMCLAACAIFIINTYTTSYYYANALFVTELIITQFFMVDFILNLYLYVSVTYLTDIMTLVDVVTILPVYLTLGTDQGQANLGFFRFIRLLRLARIFRTFKLLRTLSGVKRQMISLSLTLLCMTFLAAGVIQLLENDIAQIAYDCQYISEVTNYEPSCTSSAPATESCDCAEHHCLSNYKVGDAPGKPQEIQCTTLTFFDAFYFIVVTTATVGYGDIAPSTTYGRAFIVCFIIFSLVVIPIQINKLQVLLSLRSPFREPYSAQSHENHIILCGHVNEKSKLEKFFKEFFHPDRALSSSPDFHAVILGLGEPSEEVRSLLVSPMLDTRVTYVIGSALAVEDLKRARADTAAGMFFLCNTEVHESSVHLEDAATVLRALSVANFNPELDCLVQIIKPEDRAILKDSDVDVILCLDEFKTALIARNAICPGFSTFIENIFHSFGNVSTELEESMDPWYTEYLHGARMEIYFVPLADGFLSAMDNDFRNIATGIYLEYSVIVLGVCDLDTQDIIFNPTAKDASEYRSMEEFFKKYSVAVVIADDQLQADGITKALLDGDNIQSVLELQEREEENWPLNRKERKRKDSSSAQRRRKQSLVNKAFSGMKSRMGLPNQLKDEKQERERKFTFSLGRSTKELTRLEEEDEMPTDQGDEYVEEDDMSDDSDNFMYFGFATPFDSNSSARGARHTGVSEASVDAAEVADEVANGKMIQHRNTGEGMGRRPGTAAGGDSSRKPAPGGRKSRPSFSHASPIALRPRTLSDEDELGNDPSFTVAPSDKSRPSKSLIHAPVPLLEEGDEEEDEEESDGYSSSMHATFSSDLNRIRSRDRSVSRDVQPQLSPRDSDAEFAPPTTATPPPEQASSPLLGVPGPPPGDAPSPNSGSRKSPVNIANSSPLLTGRKRGPPRKAMGAPLAMDSDDLGNSDLGHRSPIVSGRKTNLILANRSSPPSALIQKATNGVTAAATEDQAQVATLTSQNLSRYTNVSINKMAQRKSVSVAKKRREQYELQFGKMSREIDNAYDLSQHIIVFGNDANLHMFISELRRPAVRGETYHPILVVATTKPSRWSAIVDRFNDVYFLQGSLTKTSIFAKANTEKAFSVTLMSTRDSMTKVEDENIDASTLFTYLKLEQHIPRNVFFGVELTCSANMAVLNATIMRRARAQGGKHTMLGAHNAEGTKPKPVGKSPQFLKNMKSASNGSFQELKNMFKPKPSPKFLSENQTGFGATVRNLISPASPNKNLEQNTEGRFFSSKRTSVTSIDRRRTSKATGSGSGKITPPGSANRGSIVRRSSSVVANSTALLASGTSETKQVTERRFWDAMDTHHVLPVFASGKAYVPASFESLLVQSFYSVLTPIICDKLVCGQRTQAVMQAVVPDVLVGRKFVDLLRTLAAHHVVCFGLFRAPQSRLKADLPYLYISPTPGTIIAAKDKLMLFCSCSSLDKARAACESLNPAPLRGGSY